jgi:hypothetical protein
MRELVIDIIRSRGETPSMDIKLPGVNRKTLCSLLARMCEIGILSRRTVEGPRGDQWTYRIVDDDGPYLRGEPDYAYFLRNLGKPNESECVASDC